MVIVYAITGICVSLWAIDMILNRQFILRRTTLDLPIIVFLISQFISFIFSIDQRTSLMGYYSRFNGGLVSLICYSLLYWLFVTYMDHRSTQKAISISLWSGTLVCIYGILEHYGIDSSLWVQDVQNRVFSTLGQPNWLAAYISILIFLSLAHFLSKKNWWSFPLPLIMFLTLLFTKSRSGIMATGITGIIFTWYLFFHQHIQLHRLKDKLLLFGGVCFIFILTFANPIRDFVIPPQPNLISAKSTGPALEEGGTESGVIRKIVWTGAIRIWKSNIKTVLIGTGPETFTMAYYQNRPIEHNNTSEWDLLYNKAHNEFLNYLACTGIIGLIAYLFLLAAMAKQFWPSLTPLKTSQKSPPPAVQLQKVAILCAWLTIPITNFWGFSVVTIQVYLYLLPAFLFCLQSDIPTPSLPHPRPLSFTQIIFVLIAFCLGTFLLFSIFRYWLADIKYASGQYNIKAFQTTADTSYILLAYNNLSQALELNPADPVISSELSLTTAYLSVLTSDTDATASSQLAQASLQLSERAISQSPSHPNFYKSASRTAMLLGSVYEDKLTAAADWLIKAKSYSPTDPLISYNLGVIYNMQGQLALARQEFSAALLLKPDHPGSVQQLAKMASSSGQISPLSP